jgi:transposase InsO family protein
MLDSGATHHITPHISDFASYSKIKGVVRLGDKSTVDQAGIGSVTIKSPEGYTITLNDVLHVPLVNTRFIAISALEAKGAEVIFASGRAKILISGKMIASGRRDQKLYWLDAAPISDLNHAQSVSTSIHIWHQRMGHISHSALRAHGPKALKGLDIDESTVAPKVCYGCELGKSTRQPFPGSAKKTSRILEIVHSDLAGPMQSNSLQGSAYTATFIDDYSRHAVVYYLRSKDQFVNALKQFLSWAETQTSEKMRALHSDRGGEYMAGYITDILVQRGIEHHLTMPNSPQQNGKAERFNRIIMDKAMSMLHNAGLSYGFWEHAVCTATHIYNRSPIRSLKWRTPHEIWSGGHIPDISYFRVFGCKAYVHVHKDNRKKLDPKAIEATFIGYEPGSKGYRLWDKHTRSVILSRDVKFDEDLFPSRKSDETRPTNTTDTTSSTQSRNPITLPPVPVDTSTMLPTRAHTPTQSDNDEDDVEDLLDQTIIPKIERPTTPPASTTTIPVTPKQKQPAPTSPPPRPHKPRVEALGLSPDLRVPGGMSNELRRSRRDPVPNPRYFNSDNAEHSGNRRLGHAELLAAAYVGRDPASYAEAMKSVDAKQWSDACQYEIDALHKNDTWELTNLPPGRKSIKSKWVFKLKADGRYRARLVAKGFTQIPGIDYDETFSPVARFESLRLLLALAALEDWEIQQMDVKSAFLNGVLDEEIYMEQPLGFITSGTETKVCRLKKAIYGLKQASRTWNLQFHGFLTGIGFTRTHADAGVYVNHQRKGDGPLIVILYVDDITILGSSLVAVDRLKDQIANRYEITDLGNIESYLGIRILRDRSNKRLTIDQSGYVKDILDRFGMIDANPNYTPLPSGADVHLIRYDGQASQSEITHYQSLIGSLLYVQIGTRPDISFAVSRLAQYASNPSMQHLRLAQYVLSYLLKTQDMCLSYDGAKGDGLHGYTDSSLGDQTDDRHSTCGFVFLLANAAIGWASRKQRTVAQNTTEAEYMAMADASNQGVWYRSFLRELGYDVNAPIPLHCDNKGAVDLALNPVTGRRSKHIEIRHHVVREYSESGQISLIRTPTAEMVADGFTKSLPRALLQRFNLDMGLTMP